MAETMKPKIFTRSAIKSDILRENKVIQLVGFVILMRLLMLVIVWVAFVTSANKNADTLGFGSGRLEEVLRPFGYADVSWYMDIARNGYERREFTSNQHANWAFYPLWPAILRLNQFLFGEMLISGMLVSTGLFILAVVQLYHLVERDFGAEIALRSAMLLIVFPASYFFLRPGPEALFLLLSILALNFSQRGRWFPAGIAGALATLTRLQGIVLLIPLGYLCYRQWKRIGRLDWGWAWLLLLPLAQLGFMLHMYQVSGNPLANLLMQRVWDNQLALPFTGMVEFLKRPVLISYYGWDLTPLNFLFALLAVILCVKMVLDRNIPPEYMLYAVISVLVVISRTNLNATLRYLIVIFPLFLALSTWMRKEFFYVLTVSIFSSLLFFYFVSFVNFFNWAAT